MKAHLSSDRCLLYLHTEAMGYTTATIDALIEKGWQVTLVHWDHKKLTPHSIEKRAGMTVHNRSAHDFRSLIRLAKELSPKAVVVSGWQDWSYLPLCFLMCRQQVPVLVGFDDQWFGTIKQIFGSLLGKARILSLFFSHAWVAGDRQFEFARRLGFASSDIVFDLLSADTRIFYPPSETELVDRVSKESTTYVYVGRLEEVKGMDVLLEAWSNLVKVTPHSELVVVGAGSMTDRFVDVKNITVIPFADPDVVRRYMIQADCAVVPSKKEPWGVVVHEFACCGLPIISADCVGANSRLVIHKHNGFIFRTHDAHSLLAKFLMFEEATVDMRRKMGERSFAMSARISPETSAANLLAAIR
jgi:glycosyltransferase involved in cell wall biosynthesis